MPAQYANPSTEPRLRDAIRQDIYQGGYWNSLKRDVKQIKEFYISSEKKEQLQAMPPVKRTFWLTVWVLKSLILKLSPPRRILLLLAFIFMMMGDNIEIHNNRIMLTSNISLSALILVLIILLELKDKLLARDELEAGRKVQQALMPQKSPAIEDWQIFLYTKPANDVGGDLVDHLALGGFKHILSIADVSGKGLQAALLTGKLQATIRALATNKEHAEQLFSRINEIFYRDRVPSSFASLMSIFIEEHSDILRYTNAGHLPPLLLNEAGCQEMTKGGPALAIMPESAYQEQSLSLESGDVFIAYSDGVTEARNDAGEFFGTERFLQMFSSLRSLPAEHIGEHIIRTVERFVGSAPVSDDLSLIVIKKL